MKVTDQEKLTLLFERFRDVCLVEKEVWKEIFMPREVTQGPVRTNVQDRYDVEIDDPAIEDALEANIPRDLSHIANYLKTTEVRERSLASAATAAEESARAVQENVASGLASPLEYRVTQNAFLETKSGALEAIYQHNVAVAEWDRATGRYFQFSDANTKSR